MTLAYSDDRPLGEADLDRLSFAPLARRLAAGLLERAGRGGVVIGVVGKWGSGKSSLINLTLRELGSLPIEARPGLIEFRPWLVGSRDALLSQLFSELATAIDDLELSAGDASGVTATFLKETSEKVRRFGAKLDGFGSALASLNSLIPLTGVLGDAVKGFAKLASEGGAEIPLSDAKDKLSSDLAKLSVPIVVTVDDVDRLEPTEAVELIRLIRSVADFPNIVYVMCYDDEILAHNLEVALQIPSGASFLEKIVQITVPVPLPEPWDLRRWFREEIEDLAATRTDEERNRLSLTIDLDGAGMLKTPRSVVRALNAVRFIWQGLRDEVDQPIWCGFS